MKYIVVVLFAALLVSCNSVPDKKKQVVDANRQFLVPEKTAEGSALFDGVSLGGWEVTNFGPQGPVKVSEGNIILNYGDGCTGITYKKDFPKNNYSLSLEAKRVSGNDFFCGITFPIDTTFCSFIVGGWGGPVLGLSTIDGADASENETKSMMSFEKDKWYNIKLQVSGGKIMAWIDNKKVVDFDTAGHKIGIRPEVSLSCPLGITTWNTTGALRNIRYKEL